MKHLRETFTDQEFQRLMFVKQRIAKGNDKGKLSWHDFIRQGAEALAANMRGE
jgi:hypothetical protein